MSENHEASVGVGDGSGQLFVHGSYEAVKRVQAIILENERLRRLQAFNGLTPAEVERLAIFVEEMGEASRVVGKVLRHGYESSDPTGRDTGVNRTQLEKEVGDVFGAVEMMTSSGDLKGAAIDIFTVARRASVKKYLHHQPTN